MKVRLGLLRQSLLLPSLRPYSQLARKELDPQLNGYPQLPNISRQTLPPHGWWDFQMRRNRGDTVILYPVNEPSAELLSDARA